MFENIRPAYKHELINADKSKYLIFFFGIMMSQRVLRLVEKFSRGLKSKAAEFKVLSLFSEMKLVEKRKT